MHSQSLIELQDGRTLENGGLWGGGSPFSVFSLLSPGTVGFTQAHVSLPLHKPKKQNPRSLYKSDMGFGKERRTHTATLGSGFFRIYCFNTVGVVETELQ